MDIRGVPIGRRPGHPEDAGERWHRRRWWALIAIALAVGLVIVDVTIVTVAVPAVVRDLGIGSYAAQWVQVGYTLTLAALLLPAGRMADRVGRRRTLLVGLIVLALGSVLSAAATVGAALVAGRIVAGVGGAGILPTTLALLNAIFSGRERATAFAIWGSTVGALAAVGPVLGGWLVEVLSWHAVFWANAPAALVIAVGLTRSLREPRVDDPGLHGTGVRGSDPVGVLLWTVAVAALVLAVIEGRAWGWWTPLDPPTGWWPGLSPVPVAAAGSALCLAAFLAWERARRRRRGAVLLDVGLFAMSSYRRGVLTVLLVALGQLGLLSIVPLWLQNALAYTPLEAGLMVTAVAGGSFVSAGLAPPLCARWGEAGLLRRALVVELLAAGGLAAAVGSAAGTAAVVVLLVGCGLGFGAAEAVLPGIVLADIPGDRSGQAAGVQSTAQEIGSALGVAVLSTVLFTGFGTRCAAGLSATGVAEPAESLCPGLVASAGSTIPTLSTPAARAAAGHAFSDATCEALLCAVGFLLIGLASTVTGRRRRYRTPAGGSTPSA